jgi:beta-glucosidase
MEFSFFKIQDVRVNDLVSRLTDQEIIDQLIHGGVGSAGPAPAIPKLNIGPYSWNTECLRGDVRYLFH